MEENIYNIFLNYEDETCASINYFVHRAKARDTSVFKFLKRRVEKDYKSSKRFPIRKSFTRGEYNAKARLGTSSEFLEELWRTLREPSARPLIVITPVINGKIHFNYTGHANMPLNLNDVSKEIGDGSQGVDWLTKYTNEGGINMPQLIHDDYFKAIKLTFNAGLCVSSMKLLLSCIDSISYVEFGDDRSSNSFTRWLTTYADLTKIGITPEELWELRNGLLHMTNINSNKVRKKKVRQISFLVGQTSTMSHVGPDGTYFFEYYGLIEAFSEACERWLKTYNVNREKFATFVERYDETISDSRVAMLPTSSFSP